MEEHRDNRGNLMPDHVHMLVSIPPKIGVSSFMGGLKGKSALLMSGKACEPQVEVRKQGVQKWAVMTESPGAIQD